MNSVTYNRGANQIDLNDRDNKCQTVRKRGCQSHEVWLHSLLYYLLNMKKKRFRKGKTFFYIY